MVFGVEDRPRSSWLIWQEGKVPDFVLEVASDSTRQEDAGRKRDLYARLGVPAYWRFDPTPDSRLLQPPLIGERLEAGIYAEIPVRHHEAREWRGYSDVLDLEFRADSGQLELFDPKTQALLLDCAGQTDRADQAEASLQQERARARQREDRLQQEIARLQAQLAARASQE